MREYRRTLERNIRVDVKIRRMELIKQLPVFRASCAEFISPKRVNYSLTELVDELRGFPYLTMKTISVPAGVEEGEYREQHTMTLHLISNKDAPSENCIVYLHGLGGCCLEGRFLIPYATDKFSLCLFDSRAHGKNKARTITFGLLESVELGMAVRKLAEAGYKSIATWGRSMGAVSCLKMARDHAAQSLVYVVADSPFSNFSEAGAELINRQTGLPLFLAGLLARAFEEQVHVDTSLNLAQVDVGTLAGVTLPISFLYSSIDEVVSPHHTEAIFANYQGPKDKLDLHLQHNAPRSPQVINTLLRKIHRVFKQAAASPSALRLSTAPKKKGGLSLSKSAILAQCKPRPNLPLSRPRQLNLLNSNQLLSLSNKPSSFPLQCKQSCSNNQSPQHHLNKQNFLQNKQCLQNSIYLNSEFPHSSLAESKACFGSINTQIKGSKIMTSTVRDLGSCFFSKSLKENVYTDFIDSRVIEGDFKKADSARKMIDVLSNTTKKSRFK